VRGDGLPTQACIETNAQAFARYAAHCQETGLVPIIEPEVFMPGDHSLKHCRATTKQVLLVLAPVCAE
jgi:fructose-bisphosphate aldolase, class I